MSQVKVQIIIKSQSPDQSLQVELDPATTIQEIFDFIQESLNLPVPTSQWTCFSSTKQTYFVDNSQILGNSLQAETLVINVAANAKLALTNTNRGFSQNQGNQNQNFQQGQQNSQPMFQQQPPPQQVQLQQQPNPSQNQNAKINISINVNDGSNRRTFKSAFKPQDTLNDIAQATSNYCGISSDVATVDLYIFDQAYNNQVKRDKTLYELQLKEDTTIEAKIRWYGGRK